MSGVTGCGFNSKHHGITYRPQSSSFLGLPYRILNMNPEKELLWGLWVVLSDIEFQCYVGVEP